ncbi:MAG: hypothetical protein IKV38_00905 [Clostridia bacterium]|nr:hypothetical protein [Clostridia bacterium]
MDFKDTLQDLFGLLSNAESGVFLLFASLTTILVQVIKNNFINKLAIDLKHKFDPTVLLPFLFGMVFAVINFFAIKKVDFCGMDSVVQIVVDGLSIGATSVMIYRVFATFDKNNVKTLCKDKVFYILYNQLLIVTEVRKQLLNNEISFLEFLEKLREAQSGIKALYFYQNDENEDISDEEKRKAELAKIECLKALLSGLISEDKLDEVANSLHKAYENYFAIK